MLCLQARDDETAWDHPILMKLYKIPQKVHWTGWGSDQLEEKNGTIFLALLSLPFGRIFVLLDVLLVFGFSNTSGLSIFVRFAFDSPRCSRRRLRFV